MDNIELNPDELTNEINENEEDIEKRKNKIKRDIRIIILLLIIFLIILLFTIGMGLALEQAKENSEKQYPVSVVRSEVLEVVYEETDFFDILDSRVLNDEEGLKTKPLKFSLTNTGTAKLTYDVKLVPMSDTKDETILPENQIRYKIVSSKGSGKIRTFTEARNSFLYSGSIDAKESIDYEIYIWLNADSKENLYDKSYLFKVQIEARK